ncbi:cobalt ABC transporter substrate-binding protein [Achromobacter sp. RTa]|uniref:DUF4198 domain-containing protein n=1 Tax=Achromobacter sp. RTa TaxID=1532557 RepID=UPI00050E0C7E|nr:DUF4198 domain-containing protein [Achromobacter sp. RTa]KGD93557.1 cobalt ABC transporter substrate-binding protein [Achromobacter sp. RTa]
MKKTLTLIAATLCLAATAQAHQAWLEQADDGKAVVLRFGEFAENLREASPGLLDLFGKPSATLISAKGESPLAVTKTAAGFALSAGAGKGQSIAAEDPAFPLRTFKQGDKEINSWIWPGARYVTSLAAQAPKLALDVVPTGQAGEFQVVLKGQALPKAKVVIAVQSGWSKEAHADEQGKVRFDLPWKGQYVIEASHIDRNPGERPGAAGPEKYDGINYVTTLSFVKADGAAPFPAGPAAAPSK